MLRLLRVQAVGLGLPSSNAPGSPGGLLPVRRPLGNEYVWGHLEMMLKLPMEECWVSGWGNREFASAGRVTASPKANCTSSSSFLGSIQLDWNPSPCLLNRIVTHNLVLPCLNFGLAVAADIFSNVLNPDWCFFFWWVSILFTLRTSLFSSHWRTSSQIPYPADVLSSICHGLPSHRVGVTAPARLLGETFCMVVRRRCIGWAFHWAQRPLSALQFITMAIIPTAESYNSLSKTRISLMMIMRIPRILN